MTEKLKEDGSSSSGESRKQKWTRKSKNALARSKGFVEQSAYISRAKMTEVDIRARKQRFGVEYMDLVLSLDNEATTATITTTYDRLTLCAEEARLDVLELQARREQYLTRAKEIEETTQQRLVPKPATWKDPSPLWNTVETHHPPPTPQEVRVDEEEEVHFTTTTTTSDRQDNNNNMQYPGKTSAFIAEQFYDGTPTPYYHHQPTTSNAQVQQQQPSAPPAYYDNDQF